MPTNQELEKKIKDLENEIQTIKTKGLFLQNPLDIKSKSVIENSPMRFVEALFLKILVPVFTATRADTPKNGEIWLSDIGGTRKINARIAGTTYSVTIT